MSAPHPRIPLPGEATALEEPPVDWNAIAHDGAFRTLIADKIRFLVPATIFFVVYYFALPVLVGYAPKLVETRVIGEVNVAYLFALSQFLMAWVIAGLYVRAATRWDREASEVIRRIHGDE